MLTSIKKFDILSTFTGRGIFYVNNTMALTGGDLAKALSCEHTSKCHFLLEDEMSITKECLICKKLFKTSFYRIKEKRGKYCSIKCADIGKTTSVIKSCPTCRKEFKAIPSNIKKGWNKYCSLKCRITKKGDKHHSWKGSNAGYSAIHLYIQKQLGKPKKCEHCGTTDPNKRYEWANISGKHLRDIKDWKRLCKKCHVNFDNTFPRGEKHGNSKLTEKEVLEIRKLYILNKFGYIKLSKNFNISSSNIRFIIHRKTWKHI